MVSGKPVLISFFNIYKKIISAQAPVLYYKPSNIANLKEQSRLKGMTFKKMCIKPAEMEVENFMKTLSENQYVDENTSVDIAIYQLLTGPFLSLMVVKDDNVIGVLRLTDIFLVAEQVDVERFFGETDDVAWPVRLNGFVCRLVTGLLFLMLFLFLA